MPDLSFEFLSAAPARDMLTPALSFDLRVVNRFPEQSVHAVLLRCQLQIEVARRRHTSAEQTQLRELFDQPARWGDTLRPMTWANLSVNIPAFQGSTVFPLIVRCTFDLNSATAKYFLVVESGDVPLTFLFSGSRFPREDENAPLCSRKSALPVTRLGRRREKCRARTAFFPNAHPTRM